MMKIYLNNVQKKSDSMSRFLKLNRCYYLAGVSAGVSVAGVSVAGVSAGAVSAGAASVAGVSAGVSAGAVSSVASGSVVVSAELQAVKAAIETNANTKNNFFIFLFYLGSQSYMPFLNLQKYFF
ncbi:MAG: hypothetical protein M0R38_03440 [Bacteroidia bacterium]|nr:hypothetical protein [Bacteroidia bacterium]